MIVGLFAFECESDPTPVFVAGTKPIASRRDLCFLLIALDVAV